MGKIKEIISCVLQLKNEVNLILVKIKISVFSHIFFLKCCIFKVYNTI